MVIRQHTTGQPARQFPFFKVRRADLDTVKRGCLQALF